ncbi:MAG: hypothetical protein ISS44_04140 [Candidatus Omnitrophica bacterium]|nr:hypothetical protein [Candidatus Omnitrophota bacterium]
MERKKEKLIFLGLVILLGISTIIIFTLSATRAVLQNKYSIAKKDAQRLASENRGLLDKFNTGLDEKRRLKTKIDSINEELERLSFEKEQLKNKYDLLDKEREDLLERLKKKPEVIIRTPVSEEKEVITPDAYWAAVLKEKAQLEMHLESLIDELKELRTGNRQMQRERTSLELEITGLMQDHQDLQRKFEYNQKLLDTISVELVREKNDRNQLLNNLQTIKSENKTLRRQIGLLTKQESTLQEKLDKTEEEKGGLARQIRETELMLKQKAIQIERIKTELLKPLAVAQTLQQEPKKEETKIQPEQKEQTRESVELPPIVVSSSGRQSLSGKLIAVNKDHNFVVVDLGENKGIRMGMSFSVLRDNQVIGNIEVIQVRKTIAACDIKVANTSFKIGDRVEY